MQPDRLGSRAYVWATLLVLITVGLLLWSNPPAFLQPDQLNYSVAAAQAWAVKATFTATPTATLTPTPTFTPAPTNTPADTPTAAPAAAVTLLATATSLPSIPPAPTEDVPQVSLPPGVKKGEIWIDVDLTNQYLQVYKGKNLLNGFVVSTGTWQHPTVTGQYQIYVKYPAADMAGPGYYLPSVPYVMYFYKGYGIHGTYWHNNFGTPMSHGCINLRTADAEWVYNKASVGTLVNIHY
jgi:lipoprotein-anchoring transpeptidase ErfK/SrfK